jgi:hypothetical protein
VALLLGHGGPEVQPFACALDEARAPSAVLTRTGHRLPRPGLIQVGLQHPEAVMVGARQLAEHERVKSI